MRRCSVSSSWSRRRVDSVHGIRGADIAPDVPGAQDPSRTEWTPRPARTRRGLLAGMRATLSASAAIPLAGCLAGGGAVPEVAPAAQLRKGATIVWAVDEGATRTPLRQEQVKLFKEKA